MTIRKLTMVAMVSLACITSAYAADDPASKTTTPDGMDHGDKVFFEKASQAGMTEVEMAKVAKEKAHRADVKEFADMMQTDHGSANAELKDLAKKKNVILGTTLDSDHAKMVQKLRDADADKFDKEFIKANVAAHKQAVSLFKDTANDSKDTDIHTFASKTLPVLEAHLDKIKALDKVKTK